MSKPISRQRITVFGGSGFVGRHLVQRLAHEGAEVRVAVRTMETANLLKPAGDIGQIVPWQVNIAEPSEVATAVDGVDTVINLVGILYERGKRTFQRIHVDGAGNIARAAAAAGVGKMLHMSALGADKYAPADYAQTKFAGEAAVREAFPTATVFRPSVIFGPEDNFFNMFAGIMRFLPCLPVIGAPFIPKVSFGDDGLDVDFFGDGGAKFQPVYVGDVADAFFSAITMNEAEGETYELGGPRAYSFKELMELLLAVTERKKFLVPLPLGIAEMEAMFLQYLPTPLLTPDQVRLMERDNVLSGALPGLEAFDIQAKAAEAILPTYLHRFRTPSHRNAHA